MTPKVAVKYLGRETPKTDGEKQYTDLKLTEISTLSRTKEQKC